VNTKASSFFLIREQFPDDGGFTMMAHTLGNLAHLFEMLSAGPTIKEILFIRRFPVFSTG